MLPNITPVEQAAARLCPAILCFQHPTHTDPYFAIEMAHTTGRRSWTTASHSSIEPLAGLLLL